DLASTGPSTDRYFIRSLIVELNRLSKAKSIVLMSADLMQTTNRHLHQGETPTADAEDLAGNILAFACTANPEPQDAHDLLGAYGKTSLRAQLVFAHGLRELHMRLPVDVAPSAAAHLRQETAIL